MIYKTYRVLVLAVALATCSSAFVPPHGVPSSRTSSSTSSLFAFTSSSSTTSSTTTTSSSNRREYLASSASLLGLIAGASAVGTLTWPISRAEAAAAAAAASKTKSLPKITHKAFFNVRITGFVTGEEQATKEDFSGKIVVGLFGERAPKTVERFLKYIGTPYGSEESPTYAYSSFIRCLPGEFIEAGRIKGLKKISIAGSSRYEWGDRILPDLGIDDVDTSLIHDRPGLLTKDRELEGADPTFQITLGPLPALDEVYSTIFGVVLEGMNVLTKIEEVPVYSFSPSETEGPILDNVFTTQKKLFLELGKKIGDERAVDRRGAFLKRVEILDTGILPS